GRRPDKIVAGADHRRPAGVGLGDHAGQLGPGGEQLEVDQVGAAALPHMAAEGGIGWKGRFRPAALRPGAQSDQQQLVPHGGAQAGQALGQGGGVLPALEPVGPELYAVGGQGGKGPPPGQDGGLGFFHDGQDDFGPAPSDGAAPYRDAGHDDPRSFYLYIGNTIITAARGSCQEVWSNPKKLKKGVDKGRKK